MLYESCSRYLAKIPPILIKLDLYREPLAVICSVHTLKGRSTTLSIEIKIDESWSLPTSRQELCLSHLKQNSELK